MNATHVDDNNRPYQDIRILRTHVLEDPFPDSIHLSLIQKVKKTKYLGCPPITETIHARDPMGTFRPKEESQRIEREQNTDLAAKIAKGSVSNLSEWSLFKPVSLSLSRISFYSKNTPNKFFFNPIKYILNIFLPQARTLKNLKN